LILSFWNMLIASWSILFIGVRCVNEYFPLYTTNCCVNRFLLVLSASLYYLIWLFLSLNGLFGVWGLGFVIYHPNSPNIRKKMMSMIQN